MSVRQSWIHTLVIEDSKSKRTVNLTENSYSIGRALTNSIIIYEPLASRHHATLLRTKESPDSDFSYWVIDGDLKGNKSTNGLLVNGQKCLSHKLKPGDVISIGKDALATYYLSEESVDLDPNLDSNFQTEKVSILRKNLTEESKQTFVASETIIPRRNLSQESKQTFVASETIIPRRNLSQESKQTFVAPETIIPKRNLSQEAKQTFVASENIDVNKAEASANISSSSMGRDFIFTPHNQNHHLNNSEKIEEREDLQRLASFPELSPNPIVEINTEGIITYLNPAALVQFPDIYQSALAHPILSGLITSEIKGVGKFLVREIKIDSKVYEQYVHYIAENRLIRSYIFDFTKRKEIENALRENEEKYRAVIRQASEGIFLIDANSLKLIEANDAYSYLLGYNQEEILNLTLYDLFPEEREKIDIYLQQIIKEKNFFLGETVQIRKNASLVNVELNASAIGYGGKDIYCFVARDITERKKSEEKLQYQTFYDTLTGLPNRKLFNDKLTQTLTYAKTYNQAFAVMFLDLDRFKNINDSLGHATGDLLLQSFSNRLKNCLRDKDLVARWGGDEFTLLLGEIDGIEEVAKISERIFQALKPPFKLKQDLLHVKTSIGIAIYPQDGEDIETLLRNADAALFRTKEQGRNNYQFYTPTMNAEASELLKLEMLMHHALERQEFLLYYQPQINIKTKEICGVEALIRWQHPELGLVSPAKFIPLAEESGLIVPIGEWVLKTACQQNKAWQKAGLAPIRVSVNLSPRQFQEKNLVSIVAKVLEETGLDAQWLELEITETTLMQNIKHIREALVELEQLGVQISMDDFGTGYSSLGYLKKFPFHTLKIDQSFVRDLKNNPQDIAIISAVITLGYGFNLRVIAEGVETQQQLELLRSLNCEEMQGYWFSRPLSAEDATKFLSVNCKIKL